MACAFNRAIIKKMSVYTPDLWSKSYAPGVRWDAPLPAYPLHELLERPLLGLIAPEFQPRLARRPDAQEPGAPKATVARRP